MEDDYVAKYMSPKEILDVVIRDKPFYERSGGGVTFSGGEPTCHPVFLNETAKLCKQNDIHTAIETSGYQKWEYFKIGIENIDYIFYDIKTLNKKEHIEKVGQDNHQILTNFKKLTKLKENIVVRIPVIPKFNENFKDLEAIVHFVNSLGNYKIELLPYHELGKNKYELLNREYKFEKGTKVNLKQLESWVQSINKKYSNQIVLYK